MTEGTSGGMIIQEYAEDVLQGEYSLIFISCSHSHTILKTPQFGVLSRIWWIHTRAGDEGRAPRYS